MEKGIKRRIGVLVILGMLAMVVCVPAGLAYSWSKQQHPGSRMEIIDYDDAFPYVDEEAFAIAHDDIEEILFWVQEDGNVGIGTSSPTQKLHVDGNVRITGAIYDGNNQAGTSGQLLQSTGSGIDWVDPSSISDGDWTISGNNMYSAVSGNVGIGTTSPAAKLEVAGSGNPPCSIKLTDSGDSYNERASLTYADGTGSYLRLYDDSNNQNVLIRSYGDSFFLGGNIGIGTTSPNNELHIDSSDDSCWAQMTTSQTGSGTTAGFKFGVQADSSDVFLINFQSTDMYFRTSNNNRMIIKSGGNVGIGTTSPTSLLDVDSNDIRIRSSQTPSSSSADGYTGEIAWDQNAIYVCTSGDGPGGYPDTWKRASISSW